MTVREKILWPDETKICTPKSTPSEELLICGESRRYEVHSLPVQPNCDCEDLPRLMEETGQIHV